MAQDGSVEAVQMTGQELKQARKTLGNTQKEMAFVVGANLRSYQDWEQGRYPVPRMLAVLAKRLVEAKEGAVSEARS